MFSEDKLASVGPHQGKEGPAAPVGAPCWRWPWASGDLSLQTSEALPQGCGGKKEGRVFKLNKEDPLKTLPRKTFFSWWAEVKEFYVLKAQHHTNVPSGSCVYPWTLPRQSVPVSFPPNNTSASQWPRATAVLSVRSTGHNLAPPSNTVTHVLERCTFRR